MVAWIQLLKPVVPRFVRQWRRRRIWIWFEGPFATWAEAGARSRGYATPVILARVASATRRVVRGEAAFERDSVCFARAEPDPVILPELLEALRAARGRPLVVLDFGGSLGSSYHQHRRYFPGGQALRWLVVEQPSFVELGAREFQTDELRFHPTIEDAVREGTPDIVIVSGVLHYLEQPWAVLRELAALEPSTWVFARTAFGDAPDDSAVLQHVPRSIYPASYPAWVLSRPRFDAFWRRNDVATEWRPAPEGEFDTGRLQFAFHTAIVRRTPQAWCA